MCKGTLRLNELDLLAPAEVRLQKQMKPKIHMSAIPESSGDYIRPECNKFLGFGTIGWTQLGFHNIVKKMGSTLCSCLEIGTGSHPRFVMHHIIIFPSRFPRDNPW